jgi:CRP-like cAMP-binding protein
MDGGILLQFRRGIGLCETGPNRIRSAVRWVSSRMIPAPCGAQGEWPVSVPRFAARLQPEQLRRLAFFREFTAQEVRRLFAVGAIEEYRDGELLATEGTRKQRRVLYVVVRGELHYVKRVRAERAAVVMTLRPGDVGGFLTFLNEDPSPVSVRSVGWTTVFQIGRRELQLLGADQAPLAVKLLRGVVGDAARRLGAVLDRVALTSAWALDLERHLHVLPLLPKEAVGE